MHRAREGRPTAFALRVARVCRTHAPRGVKRIHAALESCSPPG
ncbi:hypothetical protein BSLA_01r2042 [Burkholderia stabilis]|nr:hypothetical protein BSLA_01r2042 [Burkholderia stabilis]